MVKTVQKPVEKKPEVDLRDELLEVADATIRAFYRAAHESHSALYDQYLVRRNALRNQKKDG